MSFSTSPPYGSTLTGTTVNFQIVSTVANSSTTYQFYLYDSGGAQIGYGTNNTGYFTANNLPSNGSTISATMVVVNSNGTQLDRSSSIWTAYTAGSGGGGGGGGAPTFVFAPSNGAVITSATQTFSFTVSPVNSTQHLGYVLLDVGSNTQYVNLSVANGQTQGSFTSYNLPTDGRQIKLVVSLYEANGVFNYQGIAQYTSYTSVYTPPPANNTPPPANNTPPTITYPTSGSPIAGASATFQWSPPNSGAVSSYAVSLYSGSTYYYSQTLYGTSFSVSNLPQNGAILTLSVTANFSSGSAQTATAYYTSSAYSSTIAFTSPANGSVLSGTSVTFQWSAANGATGYAFQVYNAASGAYYANVSSLTTTYYTVSGLPTDGSYITALVSSTVPGVASPPSAQGSYRAYTQAAATVTLTAPPNGSVFTGSTATFGWTAVAGASYYQLDRGTLANPTAYGSTTVYTNSITVSGLPTDGSTIAVKITAYIPNQTPATSQASYIAAGASTQAPGSSIPVSPQDGGQTSITPLLIWSQPATNYIPNQTTFTVKIVDLATNTPLTPDINAGTSLSVQVPLTENLVLNKSYSWSVIAANGTNLSVPVLSYFTTAPSFRVTASDAGLGYDSNSSATNKAIAPDSGVGLDQVKVTAGLVIITGLRGAYPGRYTGKLPGDLFSS